MPKQELEKKDCGEWFMIDNKKSNVKGIRYLKNAIEIRWITPCCNKKMTSVYPFVRIGSILQDYECFHCGEQIHFDITK